MRHFTATLAAVSAAIGLFLATGPAFADATPWVGEPEAQVRLVNAGRQGDSLLLGLEFRLAPGWKTYWRDPGDAGLPPHFNWSGSDNLADVQVRWPAPTRFTTSGLDSIGYTGDLVLPVAVAAKQADQPVQVRLEIQYAACKDICLPLQAELSLEATAAATAHGPRVHRYDALVPNERSALAVADIAVDGAPGHQVLHVALTATTALQAPDLFVEAPSPFRFGRPEIVMNGDSRGAVARIPIFAGRAGTDIADTEIVLTVVDGKRALESRHRVEPRR